MYKEVTESVRVFSSVLGYMLLTPFKEAYKEEMLFF